MQVPLFQMAGWSVRETFQVISGLHWWPVCDEVSPDWSLVASRDSAASSQPEHPSLHTLFNDSLRSRAVTFNGQKCDSALTQTPPHLLPAASGAATWPLVEALTVVGQRSAAPASYRRSDYFLFFFFQGKNRPFYIFTTRLVGRTLRLIGWNNSWRAHCCTLSVLHFVFATSTAQYRAAILITPAASGAPRERRCGSLSVWINAEVFPLTALGCSVAHNQIERWQSLMGDSLRPDSVM